MVIRRIGVGSAAKLGGVIYAVFGIIAGVIFAMISMASAGFIAAASEETSMAPWFGPMFGVGSIIVLPIVYGIMGVVIGAIVAAVYNMVSGMMGGLQVDVE